MDIHEIHSTVLRLTRRITVWLPPGFRMRGPRRYPVLYLNDGQNLFDPRRAFGGMTWRVGETAARLVRRGAIRPLVIVGIDHGGTRRTREYLPVADDRNLDTRRPLGREYVEFVTREVMPFVASTYPVLRGASHAGIGGSSYGAVAALLATLVKPGVFGRLLLESPSLYLGGEYLLDRARRAERWPGRIYLGVGTAETQRQDWNEETVENVRRLDAILRRARCGPRRLLTRIEPHAAHTESAWAARFPGALTFLYRSR